MVPGPPQPRRHVFQCARHVGKRGTLTGEGRPAAGHEVGPAGGRGRGPWVRPPVGAAGNGWAQVGVACKLHEEGMVVDVCVWLLLVLSARWWHPRKKKRSALSTRCAHLGGPQLPHHDAKGKHVGLFGDRVWRAQDFRSDPWQRPSLAAHVGQKRRMTRFRQAKIGNLGHGALVLEPQQHLARYDGV